MQAIVVKILESLVMALVTRLLEYYQKQKAQSDAITTSDAKIDEHLKNFKDAYSKAFDGTPVTPEQRKKINDAIKELIRGGNSSRPSGV